MLCRVCGQSQLSHVVSASDIFDDYVYYSSTSRALVASYQTLVANCLDRYAPAMGSLVVDIGANDGIMLDRYPDGASEGWVSNHQARAALRSRKDTLSFPSFSMFRLLKRL